MTTDPWWKRDLFKKQDAWWNRDLFGRSQAQKRRWKWSDTIGLILIILFVDFIGGGVIMVSFGYLFGGWIGFLRRVGPEWRLGVSATTSGAVTVLLFGLCLHGCCRWWRTQRGLTWTKRGSMRLTALILAAFASGVAMLGVVHQSSWLVRDGIWEQRRGRFLQSQLFQLRHSGDPDGPTLESLLHKIRAQFPDVELVVMNDPSGPVILCSDLNDKTMHWVAAHLNEAITILHRPVSLGEGIEQIRREGAPPPSSR